MFTTFKQNQNFSDESVANATARKYLLDLLNCGGHYYTMREIRKNHKHDSAVKQSMCAD
jgi:hypothetical protein